MTTRGTPEGGAAAAGGEASGQGGASAGAFSGTGGEIAGASGNPPTGGAPPTGAGGDASWQCAMTMDYATIQLSPPAAGAADDLSPVVVQLLGTAQDIDSTGFSIYTCPPNADCSAAPTRVQVVAKDLDLTTALLPGSFVDVAYERQCFFSCATHLEVHSLATWGGLDNPNPSPSGIYLIADDGNGFSATGFTLLLNELPCDDPFVGNCTGNYTGLYGLDFRYGTHDPILFGNLLMGRTELRDVGIGGPLRFHNLRSFATGYCDDGGQVAYWIANTLTRL